jgi:membrane protease YdiL (CAAX protease family)
VRDRIAQFEGAHDLLVFFPLISITLSEAALFGGRVELALWGHFLTLLGCVFVPLVVEDGSVSQVFALISVFRLINIGVPPFVDNTLSFIAVVYVLVSPAVYVIARRGRTHPIREHPRFALVGLIPAVLAGGVLAEIEYAILQPESLVPALTPTTGMTIVGVMLFVGVIEEVIYRGLLQPFLQERVGRWGGILATALLYGTMHSAYGDLAPIAFAVGFGVLVGYLYDRTDSMAHVVLIHGSLNVFLFALIPLNGSMFAAL